MNGENLVYMINRTLKLALPNLFVWLLAFYMCAFS